MRGGFFVGGVGKTTEEVEMVAEMVAELVAEMALEMVAVEEAEEAERVEEVCGEGGAFAGKRKLGLAVGEGGIKGVVVAQWASISLLLAGV